jgi:hypothetical protein
VKNTLNQIAGNAMQTKNKNAMRTQQNPGNVSLESSVVSILSFDSFTSLDSLTSHCPDPTVVMACS